VLATLHGGYTFIASPGESKLSRRLNGSRIRFGRGTNRFFGKGGSWQRPLVLRRSAAIKTKWVIRQSGDFQKELPAKRRNGRQRVGLYCREADKYQRMKGTGGRAKLRLRAGNAFGGHESSGTAGDLGKSARIRKKLKNMKSMGGGGKKKRGGGRQ